MRHDFEDPHKQELLAFRQKSKNWPGSQHTSIPKKTAVEPANKSIEKE